MKSKRSKNTAEFASYIGRFAPFSKDYIGRFAPSPTGPLHFGSLIAAVASYLDARANGGRWLVRIEDIDPAREIAGASAAILACLQAHALQWDGEVLYQSRRIENYRAACAQLLAQKRAFYCTCSRLDIVGGVYTGHCRHHYMQPSSQQPYAIRVRVEHEDISFDDAIQGTICEDVASAVGDFVIYRKEDLPAYQLAVVIDDAAQGITDVVRGSDLLDSTCRQIYLQRLLNLPTPCYAHIPIIANRARQKLSKQTLARALDPLAATNNLLAALEFLQQPAPPSAHAYSAQAILQWAIEHWSLAKIPHSRALHGEKLPQRCRAFTD